MTRDPERGVILINVLILLALSTTIVYMMLSLGELSVARSQRFSEASQALVLIRGGEQSAITALRRDMLEAPDIDHPGEPWSQAIETGIEIKGGTFALEIIDARGLWNVNALADPATGLQGVQTLQAIVAALELPPQTASHIASSLAFEGPLRQLRDLTSRAGVDPGDVAVLSQLVAARPGRGGEVNINAAPVELLSILLQNPVEARFLVATRERKGFLTSEDITAARLILPPGLGYRSDLFAVRITVQIGDTVQSMQSLLERRKNAEGMPEVAVVARQNAMAAVSPPPPSS